MTEQNKILLKQSSVLFLISILCYLLGLLGGNEGWFEYKFFYFYLFFIILFFLPITIFYKLRIKQEINLKGLNILFQSISWFFILSFLYFFVYGVITTFPTYDVDLNLFKKIFIIIQVIAINQIIGLLYFLPLLVFAGLFFWNIKINQTFNKQ